MRDLGAYLDFELNVRAHIAKTTQACFYQIRCLRQIRCLLGRDVTANFVAAFFLSRLDYCNTLFVALPYTSMAPLQRVINAAARLVCNLRSREPVTPALIELHWLPIAARVQYKLCLLVHLATIGKAPVQTTYQNCCSQSLDLLRAIQSYDWPAMNNYSYHARD